MVSGEKRRALCQELGISYEVVLANKPLLEKLDRVIQLRESVPQDMAHNLALIEQAWAQRLKVMQ